MMGALCNGDNYNIKSAQHWPMRAGWRASNLRWLHLPYDEGRQAGGGERQRRSEGSSGWGGKGWRDVWNPRERRGGQPRTMMWLSLIHRANKSSQFSTTVIIEQTGGKWAGCSPETSTRSDRATQSAIWSQKIRFRAGGDSECVSVCCRLWNKPSRVINGFRYWDKASVPVHLHFCILKTQQRK